MVNPFHALLAVSTRTGFGSEVVCGPILSHVRMWSVVDFVWLIEGFSGCWWLYMDGSGAPRVQCGPTSSIPVIACQLPSAGLFCAGLFSGRRAAFGHGGNMSEVPVSYTHLTLPTKA